MAQRKTYHTNIKLAFALGLQSDWLPKEFVQSIPRSTYHAWKNEDLSKYIGAEYVSQIADNLEEIKLIYKNRNSYNRKVFISILKIKQTIINIVGKDVIASAIKEHYKEVVKVVETCKNSFVGGIQTICNHLEIKKRTFTYWKKVSQHECSISASGVCVKKVPNQITPLEFFRMKSLLMNPNYAHWPICSVWAYAIRKELVALSIASWYRYNAKYQFRKKLKKGRFKKKYTPLRAPRPNHTWHADITEYTTLDGEKHYIYFIVDNCSKFFLNWKIHDSISGEIRKQTIQEAVEQEFATHPESAKDIDLIVDGGKENNNKKVENYLKNSPITIHKKVAQKDIPESNSMVEASNKIMKYRYLFLNPSENRAELEINLANAIYDFCFNRPHYALEVYTPSEYHYGLEPEINPDFRNNAVKERIKSNKFDSCTEECD